MPHYISSLGRYKDHNGIVKTPSRNKAGYTTSCCSLCVRVSVLFSPSPPAASAFLS